MTKLGISFFFASAMVFFAASHGVFTSFGNALTEMRFKIASRTPTGEVVLVEIDAKSLDAIGLQSWPRSAQARLIDQLSELGAAEIAIDADFSGRSTPEGDAALTAALDRAGGGVVLAIGTSAITSSASRQKLDIKRPLDSFARRAWGATVDIFPDADGQVRQVPFGQIIDGAPIPSLAAMLGGYIGATDMPFIVDFSIRASDIDRISAFDILTGRIDGTRVEGRKVVVGRAMAEPGGGFKVPVYGKLSRPLIQILATETILQDRNFVTTSPISGGFGLGALALISIFVFRRQRATMTVLTLAMISVALEAMATGVQYFAPIIIDTTQWHVGLLSFTGLILAHALDLGNHLRHDRHDAQSILDKVIADNIDGVIITGADRRVLLASRAAMDILQIGDIGTLKGRLIEDIVPARMAAAVDAAFAAMNDTGSAQFSAGTTSTIKTDRNGKTRSVEYVATPSQLPGSKKARLAPEEHWVVCLTFRDITEKQRVDERLAYLARNDPLTGLANRNEYCERLDRAISTLGGGAGGGAVLSFNLDRFRNVNDTLGHAIGDLLIKAVAHRVSSLLCEDDTLARFGGDDFAVLLAKPTTRIEAGRLADQIIEAICAPMALGRHRIVIGASVGIAMIRDTDVDSEQLIRDADTALLRAKSASGSGRRFFDPQMASDIRRRREIELDLWAGFDRGEFEVHYQPQVSLRDREINGVEALVRWHHPTRGYISPAIFIPLAESTGLIEPLGAFVLREACREVASWPVPLKVAVNLSAIQFERGDLVASVRAALEMSGLPAQRLELEITESLFMHDNGAIGDILARLLEMKLSFALDDFGTGYSSLGYIRKFPIAKIKIDQAFVKGLPDDRDGLAIIRAINTLAQSLGLTTSVEGIETQDQALILTRAGCAQGQGYLFGRPQAGADIARLLQSQLRITSDAA